MGGSADNGAVALCGSTDAATNLNGENGYESLVLN
jgi:hypothetical protein